MATESTFGKDPEGLDRLLAVGIQGLGAQRNDPSTASLGRFMEKPGERIGRYKLLSVLGEGGMGIVYLAQQERPIRRQVALKVIKPGMDSTRVIARFEAERQALALLDHQNIAHVHDGGTTETGRLYVVMEYVKGLPITQHCDRHRLSIEDRLDLFRQVCHAVHHAHQKGIIHRDIKPSNILVSPEDDEAIPKIIDFGVAKAISQPLTEGTLFTEQGQVIGTPAYMSPEQVDMAIQDIDTRSDVYSLGALLYELLTGVLPFDSATLREGGIGHVRRIICETDPKTPSTRVRKLAEEARKVADNRRTEVTTLARRLQKELEWIPLKAMQKERSQRYQSALELARDIDSYLRGAPLIAGPLTVVYRLKKFVQRNRTLVAGITAVVAVLVAGVIVSTLFAIRAGQKARTAQAISDFFSKDVLAAADPLTGEKPVASLEPVLDIAVQRLDGRFEDEPLIEASIRYTLARRYWHIGRYDTAEANLNRALELRVREVGPDDKQTLVYMQELAWVYYYQSRYDEAEALLSTTVNDMRSRFDELDPILLRAISRLGWLYHLGGRNEEAVKVHGEALAVIQRRLGPDHDRTAGCRHGLAAAYGGQGRHEEAAELSRKALDIYRRVHGQEHHETLAAMLDYGNSCRLLGHYNEAEELYLEALEARRRRLGEEHFTTLLVMLKLGSMYVELGRHDEAERLLVPALETNRRVYGETDLRTLEMVSTVGVLRREQGLYAEAEELLTQVLDRSRLESGPDHPSTLKSMYELALLYIATEYYERAAPLLLDAYKGCETKLGRDDQHTIDSLKQLVTLYESWNKPDEAEKWRAKLPPKKAIVE